MPQSIFINLSVNLTERFIDMTCSSRIEQKPRLRIEYLRTEESKMKKIMNVVSWLLGKKERWDVEEVSESQILRGE